MGPSWPPLEATRDPLPCPGVSLGAPRGPPEGSQEGPKRDPRGPQEDPDWTPEWYITRGPAYILFWGAIGAPQGL
eukprot:8409389-Pyramimonas_sp.AAC.1